jgi:hypothetical protein
MSSLNKYPNVFHHLSFIRPIYIVFFILTLNSIGSAFATLNYSLNISTPGYTAIIGSVVPNLNWNCGGDGIVSSSLNLGFTFSYNGGSYTTCQVSDNGQLFLGASYTCDDNGCGGGGCNFSEKEPANLSTGTDRPAVCALWDDLGFGGGGANVTYTTTGASGNHVFTIQWTLINWKFNNGNSPYGSISFQVKLYESPAGQIDFVYNRELQVLGTGVQAPHARIGLMGASGDYYSTDETGATPSKVTQYTVTAKPAIGLQLRWTDPSSLPIELLFFNGVVQDSKILLGWGTVTETDNNYFTISRSTNAIDFKTIAQVKGAGNSTALLYYNYTDITMPDSSITFYYRLQQTDFNGKTSYEGIISASVLKDKPPNVYFNHNSGQLVISNFKKEGNFVVNIMDVLGRSVYQQSIETLKGNDELSILIPLTI